MKNQRATTVEEAREKIVAAREKIQRIMDDQQSSDLDKRGAL